MNLSVDFSPTRKRQRARDFFEPYKLKLHFLHALFVETRREGGGKRGKRDQVTRHDRGVTARLPSCCSKKRRKKDEKKKKRNETKEKGNGRRSNAFAATERKRKAAERDEKKVRRRKCGERKAS